MILSTVRLIEMLHLIELAHPATAKKRSDLLNTLTTLYNPRDTLNLDEVKM
jgi:hypothetical protein